MSELLKGMLSGIPFGIAVFLAVKFYLLAESRKCDAEISRNESDYWQTTARDLQCVVKEQKYVIERQRRLLAEEQDNADWWKQV